MTVLSVLTVLTGKTFAVDIFWVSNKSGIWSDPNNWDTGIVTDSLDNVFITRSGNYTITLDLDATIASFNLGASGGQQTLTASGRLLTIDSTSTIDNRGLLIIADSSRVLGSGTLINLGELSLENGNINCALMNQGLITIYGEINFNNNFSNDVGATLKLEGLTGIAANLTIANGFTNNGIIELTSTDSQSSAELHLFNGIFINSNTGIIQGNGILDVSGTTFINSGHINPGTSPGTLNITGNFSQDSIGAVNSEIGGLIGGTEFDQLEITDNLYLDGNLNITLINSFMPSIGDSFNIISYSSLDGEFETIIGLDIMDRRFFTVNYLSNNIILVATLINDPPEVVNDTVYTFVDSSVTISVLANDLDTDGDSLVVQSVDTVNTIGTVVIDSNNTKILYTPNTGFQGKDIFKYQASDGYGGISIGTVTITVLPVNNPPVISGLPDSLEFYGDSSVVLNVWDWVEDFETPDSLLIYMFESSEDSVLWSYDSSLGELTISAAKLYSGTASMIITVTDDYGVNAVDSLKVIVIANPITAVEGKFENKIPGAFLLKQNYPNPFNPVTNIGFELPRAVQVKIELFNIIGQKVKVLLNEQIPAGYHEIQLNTSDLTSGYYFYRMEGDNFSQVKKLLILK